MHKILLSKGSIQGIRTLLGVCAVSLSMTLGACGGTTAPPFTAPPPAPPPPPPPPPPDPFDTFEFRLNEGLGLINVLDVYRDGITGEGITIAVIDTGIEIDNTEIDDNLSPDSIDIIASRHVLDAEDPHGTFVASIAAAEKNDFGTHGVAYDAEILAIRADFPGTCDEEDGCGFFDFDIARAIDYATTKGADVINLSLTGDAPNIAELDAALDRATEAGIIIVYSAGNGEADSPATSTLYALTAGARGQVIIAGSISLAGEISDFSNRAGDDAKDVFTLAPGEMVTAAGFDNTFFFVSGTSFSAAHVSGAVALLRQNFPELTAAEIVEILLTTTVDLGDIGNDAIYGTGLIDIGAALAPIGPMALTASSGIISPASDGSLRISAAFGDAFAENSATTALASVLAADSYDRTYRIDLSDQMTALPDRRFDLAGRAAGVVYGRYHIARAGALGVVEIGFRDRWGWMDETELTPNIIGDTDTRVADVSFSLHHQLSNATTLSVHHGASLTRDLGRDAATGGLSLLSARGDAFMRFAQDGTGATLAHQLNDRTRVTVVAVYADYQIHEDFQQPGEPKTYSRTLAAVQLDHRVTNRLSVGARIGALVERGTALDMVGSGAFDAFDGATTTFTTLSATWGGARWSVTGTASYGLTNIDETGTALIRDFGSLHSTAFSMVGHWQPARLAGHRFSLGIAQPLRVENGSAVLDLPTGRNRSTREFLFTQHDLSLSPSGREIDFEIGHAFATRGGFRIASNFVYRLNPGHIANAHGGVAFFTSIDWRF